MNARDAEVLLSGAVPPGPGIWADFGAGAGTFTRALGRLLGSGSKIFAVDRDTRSIASLARGAGRGADGVEIIPVLRDFTDGIALPGTAASVLDGMLFANSLHYVAKPELTLARLGVLLRAGGRLVIVEYDGRHANRWVPYPIPPARLSEVAAAAGLAAPTVTASRPSAYGGSLYVAFTQRGS